MVLESIEFGAQLASGMVGLTVNKIDANSGRVLETIDCSDNGKFDVIHERIEISDTEFLDLHGVSDLHNIVLLCKPLERRGLFIDKYGDPRALNVIAFKREENNQEKWIFLCDSKSLFLTLANEFERAYTSCTTKTTFKKADESYTDLLDEPKEVQTKEFNYGVVKPNAKSFVEIVNLMRNTSSYDAYCAFLKYLLKEGKKKRTSMLQNK